MTAPARRDGRGESFNVAAHGLRGVASLGVFFAHLVGGPAKHIYESDEAYKEAITPFWNFGTFGVCLFFVISGFVILPSALRYSPTEFAGRRFWRIYPLFFVCTAIYIVLNAATNLYPETNNVLAVIAGLTFTNLLTDTDQITPNAWTLTYEVFFYAFTCAFVYFALRKPNKAALVIVGLLALIFVWRYPITFYFIGGALLLLLYNHYEAIREGKGHRLAEVVAAVAMVYLASRGHYNYRWSEFLNPVVAPLIVCTIVYLCLALSRHSLTTALLGNRVFRYFGTVSFSLYLVHPYTYYVTRMIFKKAHLFTDNVTLSMGLFIVATSLVTLPVVHVIYLLLERKPYEMVYHQKIYRTANQAKATI